MDLAQYFNIMNTTKLKQIIKEELKKIIKEDSSIEFTPIKSALDNFYDSYLAKDLRLSKEITSEERIERLQSFADLLKSYIDKLNSGVEEEEFWISKNQGLNEKENEETPAQKLYDDLKTEYGGNEEKGRPASIFGLRNDPEFKKLKSLDSALAKKLDNWIAHLDAMDR